MNPDNSNKLFLYNIVRGTKTNIPGVGTGSIYVNLYDTATGSNKLNTTVITGGYYSPGVYTASAELYTTSSFIYDRWFDSTLNTCYHTGTIAVKSDGDKEYIIQPSSFKQFYDHEEVAKLRFATRQRNWCPTSFTVSRQLNLSYDPIHTAYYRVTRVSDNYEIIPFGTGSIEFTRLSYDQNGNYCLLDMSLLEPGYLYAIQVGYSYNNMFYIYPQTFNFRVQ
jgi:hypothetical protein